MIFMKSETFQLSTRPPPLQRQLRTRIYAIIFQVNCYEFVFRVFRVYNDHEPLRTTCETVYHSEKRDYLLYRLYEYTHECQYVPKWCVYILTVGTNVTDLHNKFKQRQDRS